MESAVVPACPILRLLHARAVSRAGHFKEVLGAFYHGLHAVRQEDAKRLALAGAGWRCVHDDHVQLDEVVDHPQADLVTATHAPLHDVHASLAGLVFEHGNAVRHVLALASAKVFGQDEVQVRAEFLKLREVQLAVDDLANRGGEVPAVGLAVTGCPRQHAGQAGTHREVRHGPRVQRLEQRDVGL